MRWAMKTGTVYGTALRSGWKVAVLAIAGVATASAQRPPMPPCVALEHSSAGQLLEYLSRDRASLSANCIEVALRNLGIESPLPSSYKVSAIDVLIPFLDFKSQVVESMGFQPSIAPFFLYPARTALIGIGRPAVEKLIAAIADRSSSDTVVENARVAVNAIYNYPDGPAGSLKAVVALSEAAKGTLNAASASRLRDAARKVAGACLGSELQSRCEAALN